MEAKKKIEEPEFEITFQYGNETTHARVVRSVVGKEIHYIIYPLSPHVIQQFGERFTLFKEDDNFSINTSEDMAYKDYVNKIATAIEDQDLKGYS